MISKGKDVRLGEGGEIGGNGEVADNFLAPDQKWWAVGRSGLLAEGLGAERLRLVAAVFCVIIPFGLVVAVADLRRKRGGKDDQC